MIPSTKRRACIPLGIRFQMSGVDLSSVIFGASARVVNRTTFGENSLDEAKTKFFAQNTLKTAEISAISDS
jgi:hypothetical protein